MTGFLDELAWRGQLHQTAGGDALVSHLASGVRTGYCGFDPTADSLTIGNLVPIMLLMRWQRFGHKPIFLMGGGTGLIGDPSGKDAERSLRTRDEVEANVAGQRRILERLVDFDPKNPAGADLVNNLDWLEGISYLEMLRDVGKHFSVNTMIQKDSVRERLHNREQGISYTEFSYMLLQGYDYLHLRRTHTCTVQLAGSDQFGNIVAGIDLIRRDMVDRPEEEPRGYAITVPLVTDSEGRKIGKTEKGAIWLTADRTSPWAFHQYWLNVDDRDAGSFLRTFTFLDRAEIESIEAEQAAAPHTRAAQKALANAMTDLIHGENERARVEAAAAALFSGAVRDLDAPTLAEVFADVPGSTHARAGLEGDGLRFVDLLTETTLAKSKREAREFLGNGSISINGERVAKEDAVDRTVTTADLLHGRMMLLRRGKKSWHATWWE